MTPGMNGYRMAAHFDNTYELSSEQLEQLAYHVAMMLVTLCLMGMAYLKCVLPDTIIVKHGMNKFVPEHQKDWKEYKW